MGNNTIVVFVYALEGGYYVVLVVVFNYLRNNISKNNGLQRIYKL